MIVDQVEPVLGEVVIVTYEGEYSSDGRLFHGTASAVLDNRCKYDGSFRTGMFHGQGVFQWPSGVKFEGDFERGQIVGKGQYEWSDGSIYIGDVLDGRRHGSGKFVGSSGQVYEGEWVAGKRHGKGKVYYNEERTSSFTVSACGMKSGNCFADNLTLFICCCRVIGWLTCGTATAP
jgi:hypothetical protein